jgi:hypothetical protein
MLFALGHKASENILHLTLNGLQLVDAKSYLRNVEGETVFFYVKAFRETEANEIRFSNFL